MWHAKLALLLITSNKISKVILNTIRICKMMKFYSDLLSQPCRAIYILMKMNNIDFEYVKVELAQGMYYYFLWSIWSKQSFQTPLGDIDTQKTYSCIGQEIRTVAYDFLRWSNGSSTIKYISWSFGHFPLDYTHRLTLPKGIYSSTSCPQCVYQIWWCIYSFCQILLLSAHAYIHLYCN